MITNAVENRKVAQSPPKTVRGGLSAAARRLASVETQWIYDQSFQQPEAEARILGDPDAQPSATHDSWKAVRQLPAHLARLCEAALLTVAEERALFRRLNYAKYRADQLRRQLDPRRPSRSLIEEIESLLELARGDRDRIVQANVRLAVSIAKKRATAVRPFDLLLSEAIATLLKAVEKFDYQRGFRFSTYATLAIERSLWRDIKHGQRDRLRFQHAETAWFESKPADECPGTLTERRYRELSQALGDLLAQLAPRERSIIRRRFGLDGEGELPTLQSLAAEFGVCKERVRQLEKRALDRLRSLAARIPLQSSQAE